MAVRALSSPVVFSTTELDAVLRVARCCSPDATGRVSAHKTRSCPQGDRHPLINKPSTIMYCVYWLGPTHGAGTGWGRHTVRGLAGANRRCGHWMGPTHGAWTGWGRHWESLLLLLDPPGVGVCEPFDGAVAALGDFLAFVNVLFSFLVWVGGESKCHFRLKHRA